MLIYLDSSAIVKRYIKEAGTEIMDLVFEDAEAGRIKIFLTADWKLGEVARKIGINAFDIEKEGEKIRDFVESHN